MKKIYLLFIAFLALNIVSFSQGNLQFNQVLLLDASSAGVAHAVPANKVWKVENMALNSSNAYLLLSMGGNNYFLSNTSVPFNNMPFWIPGGTSFSFFTSSTLGKVSVIEFNIVP